MEQIKNQQKTNYINKYNFNLILKFWIYSGYKSIITWLFVLVAFRTFGILGGLTILFLVNVTIILKGVYMKIWKKYSEERNKND